MTNYHNPSKTLNLNHVYVIPESDFQKYALEWAKQVASQTLSWSFFEKDGKGLTQIYFDDTTIQSLLSCVGVENIHVKFAIVDNYAPHGITSPTFTTVIYGTDNLGTRCSAYHIGKPEYIDDIILPASAPIQNIGNFISGRLAKSWINVWKKLFDSSPREPEHLSGLFLTNYGYLNGYNYLMDDFMYSLFPPGTDTENYDVVILPVIHRYVDVNTGDEPVWNNTFGLVLAGTNPIVASNNGVAGQLEEVNSFYDLSLPTPPSFKPF